MDFIVVLAKVYPKNGCKDSIIEISEELIEKTREEDGNIEYQLLMSLNDNTLTFVEKWETLDDLKKHMASPHFQSLYPTLCSPIDGSPPGSPVSGILQVRTLEWVAVSFSNA